MGQLASFSAVQTLNDYWRGGQVVLIYVNAITSVHTLA